MRDGHIERVRSLGHWRLVLRPIVPLEATLSFHQCQEIVEHNRVSIRGWDFPHFSYRVDAEGGFERGENFFSCWCDWLPFLEFWRMYRSGQFLSYNAVHSDAESFGRPDAVRYLDALATIYTVTEFVEFGQRLANAGIYREGYDIELSLRNTTGRRLSAGRGRMPFWHNQGTIAENLNFTRRVEVGELSAGAIPVASSILIELFDAFGWTPDESQIRADQEAFYRREFR
jgi:hypothetical protein